MKKKTVIKVKPLSVNVCYRGRRYKAKDYTSYETEVIYSLPKMKVPDGNLKLSLDFGVSNRNSDIDNFIKPFIDILQTKYGFNDNRIYALNVKKELVKKKDEFIGFYLEELCTE